MRLRHISERQHSSSEDGSGLVRTFQVVGLFLAVTFFMVGLSIRTNGQLGTPLAEATYSVTPSPSASTSPTATPVGSWGVTINSTTLSDYGNTKSTWKKNDAYNQFGDIDCDPTALFVDVNVTYSSGIEGGQLHFYVDGTEDTNASITIFQSDNNVTVTKKVSVPGFTPFHTTHTVLAKITKGLGSEVTASDTKTTAKYYENGYPSSCWMIHPFTISPYVTHDGDGSDTLHTTVFMRGDAYLNQSDIRQDLYTSVYVTGGATPAYGPCVGLRDTFGSIYYKTVDCTIDIPAEAVSTSTYTVNYEIYELDANGILHTPEGLRHSEAYVIPANTGQCNDNANNDTDEQTDYRPYFDRGVLDGGDGWQGTSTSDPECVNFADLSES